MDGNLIRIGVIVVGLILIVFGFWSHAVKKLAVNYAVLWGLLGLLMILMGFVPVLSMWMSYLGVGTGIAFFCIGAVILLTQVEESLVISQLKLKNRELAMQVALLNQENEAIKNEVKKLVKAQREANEKENTVCH